jgi:hypothetical protein
MRGFEVTAAVRSRHLFHLCRSFRRSVGRSFFVRRTIHCHVTAGVASLCFHDVI